jgi:hypothetical protein
MRMRSRRCVSPISLLAAIVLAFALALVGAPRSSIAATSRAAVASPWQFATPFENGRTSASSVRIHNRVYVMGGYQFDSATFQLNIYDDVQWATLSHDEGLSGGWHNTTPFNIPRLGQTAARYGNYIYVIAGGDASFAYLDDVQIARVGADGNITADGWSTSPYHLHEARAAASSEVVTIDGTPYLYVIGGAGSDASGNTIHFADVEYAQIDPITGSIGPFTLDPSHFDKPRSSMTTAFVQGCLYVVGGFGDLLTDIFADVQYSCVHADGSLGPWQTSPNSMQQSRYGAEMVVVGNADGSTRFIVLGGNHGGGTYLNEVEQTTVTGSGGNSPWTVAPSSSFLPNAQWGQTGVLFAGNVYVLGGVLRSQEYLNRAIYAPVGDLFPG